MTSIKEELEKAQVLNIADVQPDVSERGEQKEPQRKQKDVLTECSRTYSVWHCPLGVPYVSIPRAGHIENYPLRSKQVRNDLNATFYKLTGSTPSSQNVEEWLRVLEAEAVNGLEFTPQIRVAGSDGKIYHDLCNENWEVIEISKTGFRVIAGHESPIKFVRRPGMLKLPAPVEGVSDLRELFAIAGVTEHSAQVLVTGILLQSLNPQGPYPICVVRGSQGSGKSTLSLMMKKLVDPNQAGLRPIPRSEHEFIIQCSNSAFISFDNISAGEVPAYFSDAACRASTGSGFSVRELYANSDEVIYDICKPLLCNGIDDSFLRGDFLDRALIIDLPVIEKGKRRMKRQIDEAFNDAHPRLLGALYYLASTSLKNLNSVHLAELPRMADCCVWVTAAEGALKWQPGTFLKEMQINQIDSNNQALDYSVLGRAVLKALPPNVDTVLAKNYEYRSAADLLELLSKHREDRNDRYWAGSPGALSQQLRRIEPLLRSAGYEVIWHKKTTTMRPITIRRVGESIAISATEPQGGA